MWQMIIGKYHPTFLGECQNAIEWSKEVVEEWLKAAMLKGQRKAAEKAKQIVSALSDHEATRSHSRHIHIDDCIKMGLKIVKLEDDDTLQDLVLTVHHAFMQTFSEAQMVNKIVENHVGTAMVLFGQPPARN